MPKRSWILLALVLLGITLVAAAEKEAKPRDMITGTIEKIDPAGNKLTVKTGKKADLMEFNTDQKMYVWTKGKALSANDLTVGDEVSVYYDVSTNVVQKIFLKPKK